MRSPYATLHSRSPLPLDICPFLGDVPRRAGAPAREIQVYLKRQAVSDAIAIATRTVDTWPMTPQANRDCPEPRLYRVPPGFRLGDGSAPTLTPAQLVFATPTEALEAGTPELEITPIPSIQEDASASHVAQPGFPGYPTAGTSSCQRPYPHQHEVKLRGNKKSRTAQPPSPGFEQTQSPPPPLMAQKTYLPIPGVDPIIRGRAANYFWRLL